jgi:hypothetical protein
VVPLRSSRRRLRQLAPRVSVRHVSADERVWEDGEQKAVEEQFGSSAVTVAAQRGQRTRWH